MPKWEDIINQKTNPGNREIVGIHTQGMIRCPHCGEDVTLIVNIPAAQIQVWTAAPGSKKPANPTYLKTNIAGVR